MIYDPVDVRISVSNKFYQAFFPQLHKLCLEQRGSTHLISLKVNKRAKKSVRIFFQVKTKQSKLKWTRKMSFLAAEFVCSVRWQSKPEVLSDQTIPIRLTQGCTLNSNLSGWRFVVLICIITWHSHLNDKRGIPETKLFIPKGFELGTTLS